MLKAKILDAKSILPLRAKVLRPGMTAEQAVFKGDELEDSFHVGVVSEAGEVIAISSYYKKCEGSDKSKNEYKLRGMAVDPDTQSKGLGTMMLDYALEILKERKASLLWCNARVSAAQFYLKKGFSSDMREFHLDPAGAHYRMRLEL